MTAGLFASASGIRAHQTKMNVISNNIANVNTLGFKSGLVQFADVFSRTISGGSAPNGILGGTNPKQIGNGVLVQEITKNFAQGGTQFTGRATDMMINGNGFFVIERIDNNLGVGNQGFFLTRAGNFNLDSSGQLVTPDGLRVRGTSQLNGSSPATIANVQIPQEFTIVKDLDVNNNILATHFGDTAELAATPAIVTGAAVAGTVNQVQVNVRLVNFTVGTSGAITATYSNGDRLSIRTDVNTQTVDPATARTEIIHLPSEGGLYSPGLNTAPLTPSQAADDGVVDIIGAVGATSIFNPPPGGNPLEGMNLNLQTATVTNPAGLVADGSNNFLVGANSGQTNFGQPASENRGNLTNGSLESSNVDLAGEFTNMVITQRGVEANSRMIRSQSEVLQTIINAV